MADSKEKVGSAPTARVAIRKTGNVSDLEADEREVDTDAEVDEEMPINTDNPYGLEQGEKVVYQEGNFMVDANGVKVKKAPKQRKERDTKPTSSMNSAVVDEDEELESEDEEAESKRKAKNDEE